MLNRMIYGEFRTKAFIILFLILLVQIIYYSFYDAVFNTTMEEVLTTTRLDKTPQMFLGNISNFEFNLVTFLPCMMVGQRGKCSALAGELNLTRKEHLGMWKKDLKDILTFADYANEKSNVVVHSIHVTVSVECSTEVKVLARQMSSDRKILFYLVNNGDEMKSLHLLSNKNEYFTPIDDNDEKSNSTIFLRNELLSKRYTWFNLTQPSTERIETSKMVFVHPGHVLPAQNKTLTKLKDMMKHYPMAIQEEKNIFPRLAGLEQFIKQANLRLQIWDEEVEESFQGKFVPGRMSFKNPFPETNDTYYKKYEEWYKKSGSSMKLLTSYRSLTSPFAEFLRNMKPISFFYINLDILDNQKTLFLDEGLNDKFSGNKCISGLYRGFMDPLLLAFPNDYTARTKMVHSRRNSFKPLYRLQTVGKCIKQRHLTWALHKVRKAGTLSKEGVTTESQVFGKNYNFYYRCHEMNARVIATAKAWSRQLQAIGVPFHFSLSTNDENTLKTLSSPVDDVNTGFTLVNQTEAGLMLPMEVINFYQVTADKLERHQDSRFTKNIGNIHYGSLDVKTYRPSWLLTQITWNPMFADIMLNPTLDDNEENQFFWFIDYDVAFTGEISQLVNLTDHTDADLLTTAVADSYATNIGDILAAEKSAYSIKWPWWHSTSEGVQYYLNQSDDICKSNSNHYGRRTTATALRLSKRMIRWVAESMFIPQQFLWIVDEAFYVTLCRLHEDEGCTYYPLNLITVDHLFQANNSSTPVEDGKYSFSPKYLSNVEINAWRLDPKKYKEFVASYQTQYQMWHPVKDPEVFPEEWWLQET